MIKKNSTFHSPGAIYFALFIELNSYTVRGYIISYYFTRVAHRCTMELKTTTFRRIGTVQYNIKIYFIYILQRTYYSYFSKRGYTNSPRGTGRHRADRPTINRN